VTDANLADCQAHPKVAINLEIGAGFLRQSDQGQRLSEVALNAGHRTSLAIVEAVGVGIEPAKPAHLPQRSGANIKKASATFGLGGSGPTDIFDR
jgi:hypothetical protein